MKKSERLKSSPGIRGIVMLTGLYLSLALASLFVIPLWEAPDEPAHYIRIRSEARMMGLVDAAEPNRWLFPPGETPLAGHPGQTLQDREGFWKKGTVVSGYERHQPPGYYLLAAPLLGLAAGDAEPPFFFNHQYELQSGPVFLHGADRDLPFRTARRAVLLLRLLSVCFGACTVILVWQITGRLIPSGPGGASIALAAAALTALLPQFVFITSVINNDALAVMLSALFFTVLIRPPGTRPLLTPVRALVLTVILAAALLTEFSLVFLLPSTLVYLAAAGPGRSRIRTAVISTAALLLPLLLILTAPGRLTAGSVHWDPLRQLGRMDTLGHNLLQWESLREASRLFFTSSWGLFGWMSIFPPPLLLGAYLAVTLLIVFGLVRVLGPRARKARAGADGTPAPGVRALFLTALAFLGFLVLRNTLFTFQPQGRMFFPLLPLAAPLAAAGLHLCFRRAPFRAWPAVVLFMLGATLYGLLGLIRPFYSPQRAPLTFTLPAESAILYGLYGAGFTVDRHDGQSTVAGLQETGALRLLNPGTRTIETALRFTAETDAPTGTLEIWDQRGLVTGFSPGSNRRFFQLDRLALPPGETVLFFHRPDGRGRAGCRLSGLTLAVPDQPSVEPSDGPTAD